MIYNKYGGKCAYCGCELGKGWHVDEIEPCVRIMKYVHGHQHPTTGEWVKSKTVFDRYEHPERLHIDNQNPACASCNINKHSGSLEDFRKLIQGFMKHLNEVNTQYKIAKRYGLVIEDIKPVKFYFETLKQQQ